MTERKNFSIFCKKTKSTELLDAFNLGDDKNIVKTAKSEDCNPLQFNLVCAFSLGPNIQGNTRTISKEQQKQFVYSLTVDDYLCEMISNEPQGTPQWLQYRLGRLTGSVMGAVLGHNPFCSHKKLLSQLLWDSFQGNEATAYGSANESIAADIFCDYKQKTCSQFSIQFCGLLVSKNAGFFAYSPDGIFEENGVRALLEIKCPFKKKLYPEIPMYYYDLWLIPLFGMTIGNVLKDTLCVLNWMLDVLKDTLFVFDWMLHVIMSIVIIKSIFFLTSTT